MLIQIILYLILIISTVFIVKKNYKKAKTKYEKCLFIVFAVIIFIPLIIYYFDRYNLPSILKYTEHINIDNWFEFLTNYVGTIIGTLISSLVVILLTIKQIQIQKDENTETKRIENMPIFKYQITNESNKEQNCIMIFPETVGNDYHLFLTIENIGLNHSKNVRYELFVNDNKIDYIEDRVNELQSFIKKDEKVELDFLFRFKYNENKNQNNKNLLIIISYEDMLGNSYKQKILVNMTITNTFGSQYKGYKTNYTNIIVENEETIK